MPPFAETMVMSSLAAICHCFCDLIKAPMRSAVVNLSKSTVLVPSLSWSVTELVACTGSALMPTGRSNPIENITSVKIAIRPFFKR